MKKYLCISMCFLAFLTATEAMAQKKLASFKDWSVFTTTENTKKVCFMTSYAKKQTGSFKKRGEVYIIITNRGGGKTPEVSINSGFNYKKGSDVELEFINKKSKKSYEFFTSEKTPEMAWAKDSNMDKEVINSLKEAEKLNVKSTSSKDTKATDLYSLSGFKSAYERMISACK
jgi:invasion protein IalB